MPDSRHEPTLSVLDSIPLRGTKLYDNDPIPRINGLLTYLRDAEPAGNEWADAYLRDAEKLLHMFHVQVDHVCKANRRIEALEKALTDSICLTCRGEGHVETVTDPQGNEYGECDSCAGTGRKETEDIDALWNLIAGWNDV